jgi:hypothetical protein
MVKLPDMSGPPRNFLLNFDYWTQVSPQHKKQVPKVGFPKSKDFPSDFG